MQFVKGYVTIARAGSNVAVVILAPHSEESVRHADGTVSMALRCASVLGLFSAN